MFYVVDRAKFAATMCAEGQGALPCARSRKRALEKPPNLKAPPVPSVAEGSHGYTRPVVVALRRRPASALRWTAATLPQPRPGKKGCRAHTEQMSEPKERQQRQVRARLDSTYPLNRPAGAFREVLLRPVPAGTKLCDATTDIGDLRKERS